jgi:hypothetical protein
MPSVALNRSPLRARWDTSRVSLEGIHCSGGKGRPAAFTSSPSNSSRATGADFAETVRKGMFSDYVRPRELIGLAPRKDAKTRATFQDLRRCCLPVQRRFGAPSILWRKRPRLRLPMCKPQKVENGTIWNVLVAKCERFTSFTSPPPCLLNRSALTTAPMPEETMTGISSRSRIR